MEQLLKEFVVGSSDILKDNLVGIYLHGSAVMGCFNPAKSDLDLLIVVNEKLSDETKRKYMDMVVELNSSAPSKGIEMSIVLKKYCNPFKYPTPFELHFSVGHIDWYKDNPSDYIHKMNGQDEDLAAHFTIIKKRGKCLYGEPIEAVFGEVPKADYLDSIWNDISEATEDIVENPMYIILNLARVMAYQQEDLILSKKEGGEWAINHLPERFHPLINTALQEYESSIEAVYDYDIANSYAEYMVGKISSDMIDEK